MNYAEEYYCTFGGHPVKIKNAKFNSARVAVCPIHKIRLRTKPRVTKHKTYPAIPRTALIGYEAKLITPNTITTWLNIETLLQNQTEAPKPNNLAGYNRTRQRISHNGITS